jgi:glucuronate isomerase
MRHPDRYFDSDPAVRSVARELYEKVARLPLVCPHGHVDPRLFADNSPFPDPATLLVIPDHYVFRMLYSQGVPLERLGVPRRDGGPVETDPRKIWQLFGKHFHLFRGTPTGCWLNDELSDVFGIEESLDGHTAMRIFDQLSEKLATPEFLPRALFERFRIEVLCTTDAATDTLEHHRLIRESGWKGCVRPTLRPDGVVDISHPAWKSEVAAMGALAGVEISDFKSYVRAIESRRAFFKSMGASATDHAALTPYTGELGPVEAEAIFQKALAGTADAEDARRFTGHMLMEMARMSIEDGLVMQFHPGCLRSHNPSVFERFGPDKGCDIPIASEFTRNLKPLLNKYGNHTRLTLVLFTLDESTYARELAPLAGHYPAVKLGPSWWFHDSIQGMIRYRQRVTETAGIYNTAGFNDDTRAFPSIPARHDLCRRVDANWLAGLVAKHIITRQEAAEMIVDVSYNLAKKTYKL